MHNGRGLTQLSARLHSFRQIVGYFDFSLSTGSLFGCTLFAYTQGTEWPVRMGRVDSSDGGAAGRIPADDAPISEIVAFMKQLGAKPGMLGFRGGGVAGLSGLWGRVLEGWYHGRVCLA
jgi:hypothetical protein